MILKLHVGSISTVLVIASILANSNGVSLDKDLSITFDQKLVLDKFKELVLRHLPHEYMQKDIYLIRWLRARNFNIQQAERMLLDNLKWREDNNMDGVQDEDWFDFETSYKYWTDGSDREGRPIAFLSLGSWDIRKAVVTGQREKLCRYLDKAIDEVNIQVRKLQDQWGNVTQVNFVVNLAGYNVIEQGCLQCIPVYIYFVSTYEQHFPGLAHKVMLLNTPGIFQVILNAIRPFMSPDTREALNVYGTNRREWEHLLYKDISRG